MTHSVPASPPCKSKPKPHAAAYVTGVGVQHGIWYDVKQEVQPLYDAFHHDQCHIALLSVLPTSNDRPSDCNACVSDYVYGYQYPQYICQIHQHMCVWQERMSSSSVILSDRTEELEYKIIVCKTGSAMYDAACKCTCCWSRHTKYKFASSPAV